jgi:starvation-inducible DNA-binding protein
MGAALRQIEAVGAFAGDIVPVAIGIRPSDRRELVELLERAVADCLILQVKLNWVYWNASGRDLLSLRAMLAEQRLDLETGTDAIADRIRSLGFLVPGSLSRLVALSELDKEAAPSTDGAVSAALANDHQTLRGCCAAPCGRRTRSRTFSRRMS